MMPTKGSQQGSRKGGNIVPVIQTALSLKEDVKLKTTENALKPNRLESAAGKSEEDRMTEKLLKNVRGILNKLTPQTIAKLMSKFKELPINSEYRLIQVTNLIYDKAVNEPIYCKAYAQMCHLCSKLEVTKTVNNVEEKVNFRELLITMCQMEFEKNKMAELDTEKWHEEINSCSDPEKKRQLQLAYEEEERLIRMKSVGNVRFVGELFKLGMLTPVIMHRCIERLLRNPNEILLECLCELLTTIGKKLEAATNLSKTAQQPVNTLHNYFQRMTELSLNKGNLSKVSPRVRFMLQDVVDLRQNKWVPKKKDKNLEIEQINIEAEGIALEINIGPNQLYHTDNRSNNRNMRNRNQNGSYSWNRGTRNSRYHKFPAPNVAFESSKILNMKNEDLSILGLRGNEMYPFPTMVGKTMETKSSAFTSSNAFSPLSSRGDERKPPQPMINSSSTSGALPVMPTSVTQSAHPSSIDPVTPTVTDTSVVEPCLKCAQLEMLQERINKLEEENEYLQTTVNAQKAALQYARLADQIKQLEELQKQLREKNSVIEDLEKKQLNSECFVRNK